MLKQNSGVLENRHLNILVIVTLLVVLSSSFVTINSKAVTEIAVIEKDLVQLPSMPVYVPVTYTGDDFPRDMTTAEQAELLIYAYNTAQADGFEDPTYLQALIWQESHAGGYEGHEVAGDEYGLRVGKRYYGVGQIKVNAAKDVFKRFPDEFPNFYQKPKKVILANGKIKRIKGRYLMTDEEIIAFLITDKKFNIRVASKYLWIMQHKTRKGKVVYVRPIDYAVTAYNRGLGNTYKTEYKKWHYTVSINEYRTTWLPKFNQANITHLDSPIDSS